MNLVSCFTWKFVLLFICVCWWGWYVMPILYEIYVCCFFFFLPKLSENQMFDCDYGQCSLKDSKVCFVNHWIGEFFQKFIWKEIYASFNFEWVNGFNGICPWFIAMYDSGCQICCNWSRLKPGYKVPAHQSTMLQINMIPHPVTLNWHWANQPCSRPLMVNTNHESNRCQFFSLWLDLTVGSKLVTFHTQSEHYTHLATFQFWKCILDLVISIKQVLLQGISLVLCKYV